MGLTWRERIQAARERGEFLPEDYGASSCFATCAVGEHHAKAPDVVVYVIAVDGMEAWPQDKPLNGLGYDFMDAVRGHEFARADSILDAIEDRVLALKRAAR